MPHDRERGPLPRLERPGLYLHVPFCDSVCPYCDFAVLIAGPQRRRGYIEALKAETELAADQHASDLRQIDTIYLGGGTPSSLDPEDLDQLVASARRHLDVVCSPWLTMEINPEHVSRQTARAWRDLGIRTASLGLQSLDDKVLRRLGRRHDAACAVKAFELLRQAGIEIISIDLIYGLDGHDPGAWRAELEKAVGLAPDHISCYQLTVHDGTVLGKALARGELRELDESTQAELFRLTHEVLASHGYDAYEVSNFASRAEHRSTHNQKYWRHTPYLGLGPSAHSFADGRRWWNRRKLRLWQASVDQSRLPIEGEERLGAVELATEAVMLGLRASEGVDTALVRRRTGIDLETGNASLVDRLVERGLLRREGSSWRPTISGLAVADGLAALFEVVET